jgi:hypothetical protein
MTYEVNFEHDPHYVSIEAQGDIPTYATQETVFKILNSPIYRPGTALLFNLLSARLPKDWSFKFFSNTDNGLQEKVFEDYEKFKMAFVVCDGVDFAKVHQMILSYRLSAVYVERRGFRDMESAVNWIKVGT